MAGDQLTPPHILTRAVTSVKSCCEDFLTSLQTSALPQSHLCSKWPKLAKMWPKKKFDQPPTSVLPPSHLCSKPALLWLTPETGCFHNEALCNIWIKKYRATFHLKLKCENKPKWASMMLLAQQPGKKISFASGNLMRCIVAVLTNANTMAASEFDKYKYDCCIWQIQVAQTRFHQSNFVNGHSWRKWAILLESSFKKNCFVFCQEIHTYPGFEEYWYWSSSSLTF